MAIQGKSREINYGFDKAIVELRKIIAEGEAASSVLDTLAQKMNITGTLKIDTADTQKRLNTLDRTLDEVLNKTGGSKSQKINLFQSSEKSMSEIHRIWQKINKDAAKGDRLPSELIGTTKQANEHGLNLLKQVNAREALGYDMSQVDPNIMRYVNRMRKETEGKSNWKYTVKDFQELFSVMNEIRGMLPEGADFSGFLPPKKAPYKYVDPSAEIIKALDEADDQDKKRIRIKEEPDKPKESKKIEDAEKTQKKQKTRKKEEEPSEEKSKRKKAKPKREKTPEETVEDEQRKEEIRKRQEGVRRQAAQKREEEERKKAQRQAEAEEIKRKAAEERQQKEEAIRRAEEELARKREEQREKEQRKEQEKQQREEEKNKKDDFLKKSQKAKDEKKEQETAKKEQQKQSSSKEQPSQQPPKQPPFIEPLVLSKQEREQVIDAFTTAKIKDQYEGQFEQMGEIKDVTKAVKNVDGKRVPVYTVSDGNTSISGTATRGKNGELYNFKFTKSSSKKGQAKINTEEAAKKAASDKENEKQRKEAINQQVEDLAKDRENFYKDYISAKESHRKARREAGFDSEAAKEAKEQKQEALNNFREKDRELNNLQYYGTDDEQSAAKKQNRAFRKKQADMDAAYERRRNKDNVQRTLKMEKEDKKEQDRYIKQSVEAAKEADDKVAKEMAKQQAADYKQQEKLRGKEIKSAEKDDEKRQIQDINSLLAQQKEQYQNLSQAKEQLANPLLGQQEQENIQKTADARQKELEATQQQIELYKKSNTEFKKDNEGNLVESGVKNKNVANTLTKGSSDFETFKKKTDDDSKARQDQYNQAINTYNKQAEQAKKELVQAELAASEVSKDDKVLQDAASFVQKLNDPNNYGLNAKNAKSITNQIKKETSDIKLAIQERQRVLTAPENFKDMQKAFGEEDVVKGLSNFGEALGIGSLQKTNISSTGSGTITFIDDLGNSVETTTVKVKDLAQTLEAIRSGEYAKTYAELGDVISRSSRDKTEAEKKRDQKVFDQQNKNEELYKGTKKERANLRTVKQFAESQQEVLSTGKATDANLVATQKLIKQFSDVEVSAENAGNKIKLVGDHTNEAMTSINQNVQKSITDTYQKKYDKMLSKSDSKTEGYSEQLNEFKNYLTELQGIKLNIFDPDSVSTLQQLLSGLDQIEKRATGNNFAKASETSLSRLNNNIQQFKTNYSRALTDDDFQLRFDQIERGFKTAESVADVNKLTSALNNLKAEANSAGLAGKSFGDLWLQRMRSLGAYLTSFVSFYQIWDAIKQGVSTVTELDTALTEMRKVSDESLNSLKSYQVESFDIADRVGTTAQQIQNSTADWMRLGETMNEASKSAETSNILLNVSEFDSIDQATTSLVSMSQAYKDVEKMDIVDKLNNIGNNYSISTDQIATALQNSAASLVTAHNDIDESIALVTAGNAITQDASKTGAGLRTIALRIQGTEEAKEELKSLGEDTDDYVVATKSKIDQQVKDFTAVASNGFQGVSVLDENGNYRSTYQILQDISDVYDEIVQTDKQYGTNHEQGLLELLAGKTRSNIAASILQNGDMLRSVYESSQNSQGSAAEENEKYLDSIEGKTEQLQNRLQELAFTSIDSEVFKGAIDGATTLLELLNQLVSSIGSVPALLAGVFGGVLAHDGYRLGGGKGIGNIFDFFTKKQYQQNLNQSSFFKEMGDSNFVGGAGGVKNLLDTAQNDEDLVKWIKSKGGVGNEDLDAGIDALNAGLIQYSDNAEKAEAASKDFSETMAQNKGQTRFESFLKNASGLLGTFASSMVTMGITMAAGWVFSKGIGLIDDYIHREENAIKAGEEAQQNINESVSSYDKLNSSLQTLGQTYSDNDAKISSSSDAISTLAEKYTELKEGVNSVTNENISLSDSDYQAYLDISNQLAQAMPSLQSGTDNAGNAILNLGNNASDAKDKLQELYNVQQQITHGDISQNLQDVYKGMVTEITGRKNGIDKQIKDLEQANKKITDSQKNFDQQLPSSGKGTFNFGEEANKSLANNLSKIIDNGLDQAKNTNKAWDYFVKDNALLYDSNYKQISINFKALEDYLGNDQQALKILRDNINAEFAKYTEKSNTELQNNNNKIAALTAQREAQWKEIVPTVQSFLKTESNFSGLDSTLQEGILNNLGNMNVDSVMNKVRDSYGGDLEFYLYGEFISPLQKTSKEQQKALSDLLTLDTSKLNFNQYSQSVSDALQKAFPNEEKLQNEWRSKLGIDSMLQQYNTQIQALSTRVSGLAREDLLQLSQEELNLAVQMTLEDGPFNGTLAELRTKIEEFKQTAQEPVPVTIQEYIQQEDSGFQKIQKATESANAGATYDSFVQNLKTAKELVESGDIGTDDFKAIAEMFSPSGSDDYANWVENLPNIEKYFTEGTEGVTNFMEKLDELGYAKFGDDGSFSFMTDKAHDLETIADEMGLSYESFLSLWGKLEDKGVNVDFFATAEEGKEKLVNLNGEILQAQMELNEAEVKYGKNSQPYKSKEEALESLRDRYKNLQEAVENYDESDAEKKKQRQQDKINEKNKELVEDSIKNFNEGDKYNEAFDTAKYRADENYKKQMDAYRDQLIKAGKEYGFDKIGQTITGTMSKDVEKSNKEQLGVLFKDINEGVTRSQTSTWLNSLNDYAKNQGKTLEGFLKENGYGSEEYASLKDYINSNGFLLEGVTDPITNAAQNASDIFTAGVQSAAQEFRNALLGKDSSLSDKDTEEKKKQLQKEKQDRENKKPHNVETDKAKEEKKKKVFKEVQESGGMPKLPGSLITKTGRWNKQSEGTSTDLSGLLKNGIFGKGFNPKELRTSAKDGLGWLLGSNQKDSEKTKKLPESVNSLTQEYSEQLTNFKTLAKKIGIDYGETKFGNIDTNNRQVLNWNKDTLAKNETALSSWGITDLKSGDFSTVLGMWDYFGDAKLPISFSPMLQGENGQPEVLTSDTVYSYINNLITNLKNSQGSWTTADLLLADAKGLDVDGKHIQGLISGVGDYADPISQITHLTGENGSLNSISGAIQNELSKAGISVDDFISNYGNKIPDELKKSLTEAPAQTSSDILSMLGLGNAENLKTSAKDVGKRFLDNMFGTDDNNISGEELSSANIPVQYDKETAEESLETVNEETSESAEPIQVSAKVGKVDPVSMQEVITSTASSMSQGISAGINIKPQTTGGVQHVTQEVDSSNLGEVNDTVQTVHQVGQPDEQMTNPAEATQNVEQEVVNPIPTVLEEATQVVNQTVNKVVGKNEDPKIKDTEAKAVITGDASKAVAAAQKAEGAIKAIPQSHHTSISASAGSAISTAKGVADAIGNIPSTKDVNIHVKQTGVSPGSVASRIGKIKGSYIGTAFQGGGKSFAKRISGSAYASGTVDKDNFPNTWKTPVAGTSLVGELGREIVVDTNSSRWYTVGDNGAEFRKIPKNAIIFNNDQTEELLSNGSLSGDSNARGTAFGGGSSSGKTLLRKSGSSSSSSSSNNKKPKRKSSEKSSGNSKSSDKNKDSKSDSKASKLSKYLENIFDWAEYRLKNLATITDRYTKLADNSQVWSKEVTKATKKIEGVNVQFTKGGAAQLYNKAIQAINKQLAGSQKALNGYQSFYKSVVQKSGLDKATIKKIQSLTASGQFNVEAFKAPKSSGKKGSSSSKNEKLQNIENISKWYQKIIDTQSSIEDLMIQRAELAQKKLDAIEDIYGAKLSVYENTMKRDQAKMEYILNTSGVTGKYFRAGQSSVKSSKQTIQAARKEYQAFERQFNKQVENGTLVKGTKSYNTNKAKLRELETKIYEAMTDLQEQITETFENIADHYEELRDRNDERLDVNEGNIDITKRNQRGYTSKRLRSLYGERNALQYNNLQLAAQELASQRANKKALISSNPKDVTAIKAADRAIEAANNKYKQAVIDYRQYLYDNKDEAVENIESYYDALEDYFSSIQEVVEANTDLKKTKGKVVTVGDYKRSIKAADDAAKVAKQRYNAVFKELKSQIEQGYITIGSEKYYQSLAKVNSMQKDMIDSENARADVYNQISQIKIDNIQSVIEGFENLNDTLSNYAELLNDMGNKRRTLGKIDEPYLRRQMGISEQTIYGYDRQRNTILSQMKGVEKYSDRWKDLNGQLQDVNGNIIEAAKNMEEFADAIREIRWDKFNKGIETIDYTKTELSDLVDILNEDNFISKNGAFTTEGLAAIALQGQSIKENIEAIEAHRVALKKLKKEYDNNVISLDEYTEESREHMDAIRDGVSAYQDVRSAMIDLYFESLEKENDLLQENIDKRRDALDKQKQYYDYQKTIKNDTKDIQYLQAQISALSGVTNENAQSKLASLRSQLADATEQYNDDKQNHYFDLMNQGYDKLTEDAGKSMEDIEDAVRRSTEKQTQIIKEMLNTAGGEYKKVYDFINKVIKDNGIVLSTNTNKTVTDLGKTKTAITNIGLTYSKITNQMKIDSENITGAKGILTTAINKLGMTNGKLDQIVKKTVSIKSGFTNIGLEIDKITKSFNNASKSILKTASDSLAQIKKLNDAANNSVKKASSSGKKKATTAAKKDSGNLLKGKNTSSKNIKDATTVAATGKNAKNTTAKKATAKKTYTTSEAKEYAIAYIMQNSKKTAKSLIKSAKYQLSKDIAAINGDKTLSNKQVEYLVNQVNKMLGKSGKNAITSAKLFAMIKDNLKKAIAGKGFTVSGTSVIKPKAYAKGSEDIDEKQLAITNESGWEAIYRKSDGAILTPLNVGDKVFTNEMSENLWKLAQGNNFGAETISKASSPVVTNVETYKPNITVSFENFMTVQGNVDKDVLGDLKNLKNEWMTDFSKHLTKEFGLLGNKRRFS